MKRHILVILMTVSMILSGYGVDVSAFDPAAIPAPVESRNASEPERNDLFLAALSGGHDAGKGQPVAAARTSSRFGLRQWHRYLGYGTLILAGMTAVTSSEKSAHYACAYSATGAAVATCVTGYLKYGRRFNPSRGLLGDDNLHIILGVAGTIGMAAAVVMADHEGEGGHAAIGTAGGASMLVSLIVIKW